MKVKKIYIVTDASIPIGFARTNRILSYATGFQKNHIACEMLIFRKTEQVNHVVNQSKKGVVKGIPFRYLLNSPVKSACFIKRRIDNFRGVLSLSYESLFKMERNSVIIYDSSHTAPLFLLAVTKFLRKDFLLLREESDDPEMRKKTKNKLSWFLYNHFHYHLFDGFLLMTKKLIEYFKEHYPNIPYAHIPMTVDIDRFKTDNEPLKKQITYIGSMNNKKDGILYLLEAFSSIKDNYKDFKLLICSFSSSESEKKILQDKINSINNHRQCVIYKENVKSNEIPGILKSSYILVLPRPNTQVGRFGFPTKLGEYLASGIPTIVTPVGEIPNYLTDGQNAFVSEPGNSESLIEKMRQILDNYEKAEKVGLRGKETAERYFNNIIQTKRIISFIQQTY